MVFRFLVSKIKKLLGEKETGSAEINAETEIKQEVQAVPEVRQNVPKKPKADNSAKRNMGELIKMCPDVFTDKQKQIYTKPSKVNLDSNVIKKRENTYKTLKEEFKINIDELKKVK